MGDAESADASGDGRQSRRALLLAATPPAAGAVKPVPAWVQGQQAHTVHLQRDRPVPVDGQPSTRPRALPTWLYLPPAGVGHETWTPA